MGKLMSDFSLTDVDAAAIVGNLGHESGGFKFLQEKKPLIPGSAGGYGWAQWTGPRRKAYEAYCSRNKLDPASDKANYGFLFVELMGRESAAIPAVKRVAGLEAKVKAFELSFERAHKDHKHYPSRVSYANKALIAFRRKPSGAGATAGGAAGGAVITGCGTVVATEASKQGASVGQIAIVVGITLLVAVAVFFAIRFWRR
jgi:hypothetical protein